MTLPRPLKVGDVCRCRNGDVVYVYGVAGHSCWSVNFANQTSGYLRNVNTGIDRHSHFDITEILAEGVDLSCMGEQHPQSKNMKLCHQNGNFIYMDAYHPPKKTWAFRLNAGLGMTIDIIEADSESEAWAKLKASGAIRLEEKP